jgi:hypothetical protein
MRTKVVKILPPMDTPERHGRKQHRRLPKRIDPAWGRKSQPTVAVLQTEDEPLE